MSNQPATELRRQLTLQMIDPELHNKIINFPIHLSGDLMETYNDATLRCTVRKILAIYLPKSGKKVEKVMEFMLPAHYKFKYSDSEIHTGHYKGNKK